ncbi:MAG: phosphomethylpyrimidine synthase [Methylophagaceae bacterium]|jgi:phosphomethylpyrimidine synthase
MQISHDIKAAFAEKSEEFKAGGSKIYNQV